MRIFAFTVLVALAALAMGAPSAQKQRDGSRLIQFSEHSLPMWLTTAEIDEAASLDINFMDVTDLANSDKIPTPKVLLDIPTTIRFPTYVDIAITRISLQRMQEFLTPFSAFFNRYYTSATGVESSNYLFARIQSIIASSGYPGQVTVNQYTHGAWAQKSIIARLEGTDTSSADIVVLGAHQDSITSGANSQAPGADDNGTGSTVILEAFTTLLESGFIPKHSIEFQWYAAEEVGLRGSQEIAVDYKEKGIPVAGMANFDMAGYLTANQRIAIYTDYNDPTLTNFLEMVARQYSSYATQRQTCGYACSDHASYFRQGLRSAMAGEDRINPNLHTIRDTLTFVTFNHVREFAKIAVGFAIELGEPSN